MKNTALKTALSAILLSISFIIYARSPLDRRIDSLVAAMNLQEKLEQLFNVRVSFGGTAANTRLGIPGFVMSDGPHGVRFTGEAFGRTATAFPTGIALTATWDEALAERVGQAMGLEFWSFKRNQALGPCLDLARDSRGGRTAESGGEDPFLSAHLTKAIVAGIQQYPVIATLKHFMGESKQLNRLKMNVTASQRWVMDFSGYNFRIPMQEAGAMCVMGAYNKINGDKCNESSILLKTILRGHWGFPFYVVSDWASIDDARKALRAGTDVCMGSSIYEVDLPVLEANQLITTAEIEAAVRNVLKTKILAGMTDHFPPGNEANAQTPAIQSLNRLAAQKSLILLKNEPSAGETPILPLQKQGVKIALIGPNAAAENLNCFGSSATNPPYAVSIKKGLEDKVGTAAVSYARGCNINSSFANGMEEAKAIAAAADVVIFAGGLNDSLEGEGYGRGVDRVGDSFALPAVQQTLINELAAVNPNLIAVLQSGGVCSLSGCLPAIKGLIYSFYAAQEAGHAIADVLFGDYNPAGRMPLSMPKQDGDFPSWDENVFARFEQNRDGGYRWLDENGITPQYAFGFGLSYTTFSYARLTAPATVSTGQPFSATVDVSNTGSIAGEEVVQLYISRPSAANLWMPEKELRGFKRIALNPGETKTVTFDFCADDFYYWNSSAGKYDVPAGVYTLRAGGSSDRLPLSHQVAFVAGDARPDLRITRIYTMPRYPVEGQSVSFYALVKNQGNLAVRPQTPYDITFDIAGQEVSATLHPAVAIAPGQVQLIASDREWVAGTAGKTTLTARLSFADPNAEWDAGNNLLTSGFEVFADAPETTNVACLKNAAASSETGRYTAHLAIDGDLSTRWESQRTDNEQLLIDLEALCEIEKIHIYWETAFAKRYAIDQSTDGTDWTELKSVNNGAGHVESHDFEKFEARYIRIRCLERPVIGGNQYAYSIYEVEVQGVVLQKMPSARITCPQETLLLPYAKTYLDGTPSKGADASPPACRWEQIDGPAPAVIAHPDRPLTEVAFDRSGVYRFRLTVESNGHSDSKTAAVTVGDVTASTDLALKKPASASGSEMISTYPHAAVDGNESTRWSSLHADNQWWQVDLQHQIRPSQIIINWQSAYARQFDVMISADAQTWHTYAANSAFAGGTATLPNDANLAGRYLRVNCIARAGQWGSSFYTVNLYGRYDPTANRPPRARAAFVRQAGSIVLDASESSDADGDPLSYRWEQIAGPAFVTIHQATGAAVSFAAMPAGDCYFKLTVDDGKDIDFTILQVPTALDTKIAAPTAGLDRTTVYPNPISEVLYIQNPAADPTVRVDIYDPQGRRLLSETTDAGCISLKNLANGLYLLSVHRAGKRPENFRIVKRKL